MPKTDEDYKELFEQRETSMQGALKEGKLGVEAAEMFPDQPADAAMHFAEAARLSQDAEITQRAIDG